jgi:hypothetical protein
MENVNEMTQKERDKRMLKFADKFIEEYYASLESIDQMCEILTTMIEIKGELLAKHDIGITNRDMLKWTIGENIKRQQAFVETIKQFEQTHKLPLEYLD